MTNDCDENCQSCTRPQPGPWRPGAATQEPAPDVHVERVRFQVAVAGFRR